ASGGPGFAAWAKEAIDSDPCSYTFTIGARSTGAMSAFDCNEVDLSVSGYSSDYRGTWNPSANGRSATGFANEDQVLNLFFGGNECVAGVSHVPSFIPPGFTELANVQSGSGTTGSRTALWVGWRDKDSEAVAAASIGWSQVSGESAQQVALLIKSEPPIEPTGFPVKLTNGITAMATIFIGGQRVIPENISRFKSGFGNVQ